MMQTFTAVRCREWRGAAAQAGALRLCYRPRPAGSRFPHTLSLPQVPRISPSNPATPFACTGASVPDSIATCCICAEIVLHGVVQPEAPDHLCTACDTREKSAAREAAEMLHHYLLAAGLAGPAAGAAEAAAGPAEPDAAGPAVSTADTAYAAAGATADTSSEARPNSTTAASAQVAASLSPGGADKPGGVPAAAAAVRAPAASAQSGAAVSVDQPRQQPAGGNSGPDGDGDSGTGTGDPGVGGLLSTVKLAGRGLMLLHLKGGLQAMMQDPCRQLSGPSFSVQRSLRGFQPACPEAPAPPCHMAFTVSARRWCAGHFSTSSRHGAAGRHGCRHSAAPDVSACARATCVSLLTAFA